MSIASEIERLKNAKTSIASAIEEKGVAVPAETSIDEYGNYVSLIPSGDYATKEELEALSNTANAADRVKYESGVLKTLGGTEIVTGNARIATGSYVGTGTCGESNPNSLTFDFVPKLLMIVEEGDSIRGSSDADAWYNCGVWIYGAFGFYVCYLSGNSICKNNTVSVDEKTLSWYVESSGNAIYQLNTQGTVYSYIAIG